MTTNADWEYGACEQSIGTPVWICMSKTCGSAAIEQEPGQCAGCGENLSERWADELPCLAQAKVPLVGVGSAYWAQQVSDALADHGFDLTHPVEAVKALILTRDRLTNQVAALSEQVSAWRSADVKRVQLTDALRADRNDARRLSDEAAVQRAAVEVALDKAGYPPDGDRSPAMRILVLADERDALLKKLREHQAAWNHMCDDYNEERQEHAATRDILWKATESLEQDRAALDKERKMTDSATSAANNAAWVSLRLRRKFRRFRRLCDVLSTAYQRQEEQLKQARDQDDDWRSQLIHADAVFERVEAMLSAAGYDSDIEASLAEALRDATASREHHIGEKADDASVEEIVVETVLKVGDNVTLLDVNGARELAAIITDFSGWCLRVRGNAEPPGLMADGWYSQKTGASESANQKPWIIAESDVKRMPFNQEVK